MKKASGFLFVMFVATTALASPMSMQRILTQALNGERTAVARYDAFAAKADADGYAGVAALFRACAKAERIHVARFTKLMTSREIPLPADETPKIDVRSTRSNLEDSVASEQAERDGAYLYAINAANDLQDTAAAKLFDVTRDTEIEHANLMSAALRDLEKMRAPHHYYVCNACGYTTDVTLPLCPSCGNHAPPAAAH